MQDYILRATAVSETIRIFISTTKALANQAQMLHKTTPVATAALGRTLTAAAMMGATLKNDTDLISIVIKGDGPIGGISVTANNQCEVKGYVHHPQIPFAKNTSGKLDVGGAVGAGTLTVIKDMGLKEPVSGQTELVSGEIAEDFTYYFATSEQTPTSVSLGVLVDRDYSVRQSGGFIIQLMPDAADETVLRLEKALPMLSSFSSMLESGKTPEDILFQIFPDAVIHETIYPKFHCNCSAEKTKSALISVGTKELRQILAEDGEATIHCHFCNKDYYYSGDDLKGIIALV